MMCNLYLRDLLDHIKKRHRDDYFTPGDIKDSTLVVCPCGRVVLNQAGLIKHRLRYDCPEATQRPYIRGSTPLTSSPPSTAESNHGAAPSSSPLSSAPPSTLTPPGDLLAGRTLDAPTYKSPTLSSTGQRSVSFSFHVDWTPKLTSQVLQLGIVSPSPVILFTQSSSSLNTDSDQLLVFSTHHSNR